MSAFAMNSYFAILNQYRLSAVQTNGILLAQHNLLPAYQQILFLLTNQTKNGDQAKWLNMFKYATVLLHKSITEIEPWVNTRLIITPLQNITNEHTLLALAISRLSLDCVVHLSQLQVDVKKNAKKPYQLFERIPRNFSRTLLKEIIAHQRHFINFTAQYNLSDEKTFIVFNKLNLLKRIYETIFKIAQTSFTWTRKVHYIYYFSILDFALSISLEFTLNAFSCFFHAISQELGVSVHEKTLQMQCEQIRLFARLMRLKSLGKLYRPLGFLTEKCLKLQLTNSQDSLDRAKQKGYLPSKMECAINDFHIQLSSHTRTQVHLIIRKFSYYFILEKPYKRENCAFTCDLQGVLNTTRDVCDFIFTCVCSEEDIAYLFSYSQALLDLARQRLSELNIDYNNDEIMKNHKLHKSLQKLMQNFNKKIDYASLYSTFPNFLERPYSWEKIYAWSKEFLLPGYNPNTKRVWIVNSN